MTQLPTSVALTYFSGAGHTRRLAEAIAEGIKAAGASVDLVDVADLGRIDWQDLHAAQAIVFGAPTYMGSAAAPFKAFMDATSDFWAEERWRDKIAGGFTVGSATSGDKSGTLISFATLAMQHGMIWVGQAEIGPPARPDNAGLNADGFWLGLAVTASRDKSILIDPDGLDTARLYGQRLARSAQRWGLA